MTSLLLGVASQLMMRQLAWFPFQCRTRSGENCPVTPDERNDPERLERYDAAVRPHAEAMLSLIDRQRDQLEQRGSTPAIGAPAMEQIAVQSSLSLPGASTPIDQAITTGMQYLSAGADHVQSICTLVLAEPTVVYSDKVLLRAAVEAYARAGWLLDRVTAQERVRRFTNDLMHRYEREAHLVNLWMQADVVDERLDRRDRLALAAEAKGLGDVRRDRKNRIVSVGDARPTATAVMSFLMEDDDESKIGAGIQRWYSEFTHSNISALVHQVHAEHLLDEPTTGDLISAPLVSDSSDVQSTIQLALGAFRRATVLLHDLLGWGDGWDDAYLESWRVIRQGGRGRTEDEDQVPGTP